MTRGSLGVVESNRPPGNTTDLVGLALRGDLDVVLVTSDPASVPELPLPRSSIVEADTGSAAAILGALESRASTRWVGVTTAHDFYVPVAAEVAARMGLPGPDPAAVRACRRKDEQRRLVGSAVAQPAFALARSPEDAVGAAERIGYPVVLKPVALADSIGVAVCADAAQTRAHAAALGSDPRFRPRRTAPGHVLGEVLVEACVGGREFAVEVYDGRAVAVCETQFTPPPGFVEYQHLVGSADEAGEAVEHAALRAGAEQAVAALGLGFGCVHVEMRWDRGAPTLIEVNPRLAGGRLPELHRRARGIDLWQASLAAALGQSYDVRPTRDRAAALRFVHLAPGAVLPPSSTGDPGLSADLTLTAPGAPAAGRPARSSDVAGWALVDGPDTGACVRRLDELWGQLAEQVALWWSAPRAGGTG